MQKIILIIISISAASVFGKSIGLKELQEKAKKNNFKVNAARYEVKAATSDVKGSKSSFLPKLGVEGTWTSNKTDKLKNSENTSAIYGDLNLFNGFKDQNQVAQKKLFLKIADSKLRSNELSLKLEIERTFYLHQFLIKKLGVVKAALARNKKHLALIKKRLNSSLVTKTDLLEFELKRSRLIAISDVLKLKIKEVSRRIFQISGFIHPLHLSLKGSLPHLEVKSSLVELKEQFIENSEVLKRPSLEIKAAAYEVSKANSNWLPKIDLKAKYGNLAKDETGFDNFEKSTSIGIFAKWELFSGLETKRKSNKANYEKIKREYLLKQVKVDGMGEIEGLYARLLTFEKQILAEERNADIASELYSQTVEEYKKGVKDSGALSSAGDQLTDINHKIIELKNEYIVGKVTLESLVGTNIQFKRVKHNKD